MLPLSEILDELRFLQIRVSVTEGVPTLHPPKEWTDQQKERFQDLKAFLPMYRDQLIDHFAAKCGACGRRIDCAEDRARLVSAHFCDRSECPEKRVHQ